jgi:tRNA-dihydrouridine synthase B
MNLILAPLHGFTDATFRNVYFRHFEGIDEAIAPFISLTHGDKITALKVKDVLPLVNTHKPLIPQILGNNARDFILLCHFLSGELGYKEVNWNLGCPINGIVRKKRGSGLLPHPGLIDRLLSEIIPQLSIELSIKLRLGLNSVDEFQPVVEVLNKYPLKNITIHPRLGTQQYEGEVMLDEFERLLPLVRHKVIYNGDIHQYRNYMSIRQRFPAIEDFMLGRGVFYNPFLPEMIKAGSPGLPDDSMQRFVRFYGDLETSVRNTRKSWVSKMKEYWKYFSYYLQLDEEVTSRILRCKSEMEWENLISEILIKSS